jgi:5-methylcytosine-specific restriction endonuclease McrA
VLALVRQRQRRMQRTLERAHAALAGELAERRRQPIPRAVRLAVFERDGGRCVECGSGFEIQYDHVIPLALGGAGTVENVQILCAPCNRSKGASLR